MYFQWRKEWTTPAVGVVSFAAGAAAGWFAYQRKMGFDVEKTVTTTVEAFQELEFEPIPNPFEDLAQVVTDTNQKLNDFIEAFRKGVQKQLQPEVQPQPNPDVTVQIEKAVEALPDTEQPEWNYEEEQTDRTPDAPYIIHRDEFFNEETGYVQNSITWYEGDKILADEADVPIYAPDKIVGQLRFGWGSGDPDVVYIRNEKLAAEYEITRNPGHFQIEVLGLEAEEQADEDDLRHSQAIRRFRMD